MSNIYRDETVTVRVAFRDYTGDLEDPVSTEVTVVDSTGDAVGGGTLTRESLGTYTYQWSSAVAGSFTLEFKGTFTTGDVSIIPVHFDVLDPAAPSSGSESVSLGEDFVAIFLSDLDPMAIDHEEILTFFDEARPEEVLELIYLYTSEALQLTGETEVTPLMRDYVRAAVACALDRTYNDEYGGGETEFSLGDLQVTKRGAAASGKTTIVNATTWCELAALLREELLRGGKAGMKAVVKGDKWDNPIPARALARQEWRRH